MTARICDAVQLASRVIAVIAKRPLRAPSACIRSAISARISATEIRNPDFVAYVQGGRGGFGARSRRPRNFAEAFRAPRPKKSGRRRSSTQDRPEAITPMTTSQDPRGGDGPTD